MVETIYKKGYTEVSFESLFDVDNSAPNTDVSNIVNELLNEVDAYNEHYYYNNFYPQIPINDKNGTKTRNEMKKGETILIECLNLY